MGMYDVVKLEHTDPVTGEKIKGFQTKCGPQKLRTMTPKELLDYNEYDMDGVNFYDYYYEYGENDEYDSYYEEYCYIADRKVWKHILTRKRVKPRSLQEGGPIMSNEATLIDEEIGETKLWLDKEKFMQEMSDQWDEKHAEKES